MADVGKKVITPALSLYVEGIMEKWGVPGLMLAVVRPDGETETRAWGRRSEAGDPATPDTLFAIASCSKAFLAAAMGILLDDHASGRIVSPVPVRLAWDTKLRDALPDDLALMDAWADAKTDLRDALSHVTGVTGHELAITPDDMPVDVVRRMRHLRPAHELRKNFSYANHMYIIVSYLISRYSGMSYPDFVRTRIFAPLGMNSSTFDPSAEHMSQLWTDGGRRVPPLVGRKSVDLAAAPGGAISSANDLAKWVNMLLAHGVDPTTNKTIIPRAAFDMITTSLQICTLPLGPDLNVVSYGMGWFKGTYEGRLVLAHPGAIRGFGSLVSFFPKEGLGVAVALNTDVTYNVPEAIAYHIANKVLGLDGGKDLRELIGNTLSTPEPRGTPAPLPLAAYAGTYVNSGYGTITLCAPTLSPPGPSSPSAPSASKDMVDHTPSEYEGCSRVLADFRAVQEMPDAPLPPALYAVWPRLWGTHARLTHLSQDLGSGASSNTTTLHHAFALATETHFPSGFGADATPFLLRRESGNRMAVEFVVDEEKEGEEGKVVGFGMWYLGVQPTLLERKEGSVQDRALVWYDKV